MFNELRRNNWTYLLDTFLMECKNCWFLIILAIANWEKSGLLIILVGISLSIITVAILYFNTKFCVKDMLLIYKRGIINKKSTNIPFEKITTIDMNISIIDRMFNTCSLKIDTGAAKISGEEVKIKLTLKEAEQLKTMVLSKKNIIENKEEVEDSYEYKKRITIKEILIYSLTSGKLLWALGAYFIIIQFIQEVEETLQIAITDKVNNYVDLEGVLQKEVSTLILLGIGVFFLIYILVTIVFIIYQNIRLYGYTLISDKKKMLISYGLISKKQYTISIDKINAIRYKQGILQQILGLFTIEAITIGYGDEENEKALVYPIANRKLLNEIIKKLIKNNEKDIKIEKPPKRALSFFIVKRSILFMLLLIPMFYIYINEFIVLKIVIFLMFIICNSILGFINYKNTSIGVNDKIIITSAGSLNKITNIINQNAVQSIGIKESPFQRRKKVYSFIIDIYSNKFGEEVVIKNMDKEIKKSLYSNLII